MPDLNCKVTVRKLMRSVTTCQNREKVIEYINASSSIPEWDLLLWTFPELKEKYRQSLIALHQELVPNYISAQDIYSKLWELFKEIALKGSQYQIANKLAQKLSEFCSEVKKPLTTYDIIYEIRNFDVGDSNFTFGNIELFKLSPQRLADMGLIKDSSVVEDTIFNEWIGKSVIKTEVSISELNRAHESGLNIISDILDTIRLIAVWGRLDKPDDEMFLWEIGQSMTIPKVVRYEGTTVGTSYHRGFRPFIIPMDKAINKGLEDQKTFGLLLEGEFPEDIKNRIFKAVKWISNAVTSSNIDYKLVYLCTVLEILLLPDHTEGLKGELIALRQVLLGRSSYHNPISLLNHYKRRSNIIHSGTLEITDYLSYWRLLICCFQVLQNIVSLSKRNPYVQKLTDLIKLVENAETLQHFIHNCEIGIYEGEGIDEIKGAAQSRLEQI